MNIQVRTQGFDLTDAIQAHVNRQLRRHLASVEEHIMVAEVYLRDINGPKGGEDKKVLINLILTSRTSVTVEQTGSDLYTTIYAAARTAKQSATRTLRKKQNRQRGRLREMRQNAEEELVASL
jgi:putative sigma-54 modulation protein